VSGLSHQRLWHTEVVRVKVDLVSMCHLGKTCGDGAIGSFDFVYLCLYNTSIVCDASFLSGLSVFSKMRFIGHMKNTNMAISSADHFSGHQTETTMSNQMSGVVFTFLFYTTQADKNSMNVVNLTVIVLIIMCFCL
jgi:hypothetical protein